MSVNYLKIKPYSTTNILRIVLFFKIRTGNQSKQDIGISKKMNLCFLVKNSN